MASAKTKVIEYLFFQNWDDESKSLKKTMMSMRDVESAIKHCNALPDRVRDLKTDNPANFLKDVVRNTRAKNNWPASVTALGYTGEQRPGGGNVFEFILMPAGQEDAYEDSFRPTEETPVHALQSLSMSRASKELGRSDEAWLIQTIVNLRIIEQYMAQASSLEILEVVHLQMTVKLRKTEIDALYLATIRTGGSEERALITCEAKRYNERILEPQMANQVEAALSVSELSIATVIPIAVRSVKGKGVHVIEFDRVARSQLPNFRPLRKVGDALYELLPPVKGI